MSDARLIIGDVHDARDARASRATLTDLARTVYRRTPETT